MEQIATGENATKEEAPVGGKVGMEIVHIRVVDGDVVHIEGGEEAPGGPERPIDGPDPPEETGRETEETACRQVGAGASHCHHLQGRFSREKPPSENVRPRHDGRDQKKEGGWLKLLKIRPFHFPRPETRSSIGGI
jgi:hypothetical protein